LKIAKIETSGKVVVLKENEINFQVFHIFFDLFCPRINIMFFGKNYFFIKLILHFFFSKKEESSWRKESEDEVSFQMQKNS